MKQANIYRILALLAAICVLAVLPLAACGGSADPGPTPTTESQAPDTVPTATLESIASEAAPPALPDEGDDTPPTPTATEAPPSIATDTPSPTATEAPPPAVEVGGESREIGEYEGVTFVVSEGSEATFTVEEQLSRLPLPNDAVMRTSALSGEVYLDGRPSEVQIDLHQLSSDQTYRDRYVRERMFPDSQYATFAVTDGGPVPEGLASGQEVSAQVTGSLQIRDVTVPLMFEVESRDDGGSMFILGRTTFTWEQLSISPPKASVVTSIEDDVRVEVLLALVPEEP